MSEFVAILEAHYTQFLPALPSLNLTPEKLAKLLLLLTNVSVSSSEVAELLSPQQALELSLESKPVTHIPNLAEICAEILEIEELKRAQLADLQINILDTSPNLCALVTPPIATDILWHYQKVATIAQTNPANFKFDLFKDTEYLQNVPNKVKSKVQHMLANKAVLCARVDLSKANNDPSFGKKCKAQLDYRIAKLLEPPKSKRDIALPKPVEHKPNKRGGRKQRKQKQKQAQQQVQNSNNQFLHTSI